MNNDTVDVKELREAFGLTSSPKVDGRRVRGDATRERKRIESLNKLLNRSDYKRIQQIRIMRYEKLMTLQQIADVFGVSRERIRQLLNDPQGHVVQQTRIARDRQVFQQYPELTNDELGEKMEVSCNYVARMRRGTRHAIKQDSSIGKGTYIKNKISEQLMEMGIQNELMPHGHAFDIRTKDGLRIDVKAAFSEFMAPSIKKRNPHRLWHFSTRKRGKGDYADFFICVVVPLDAVFVIPFSEVKEEILLTWPHAFKVTRYEKYFEAFHLLKTDS